MANLVTLYERAVDGFAARVDAVGDDQWHLPTPNADWDVAALVNHLVSESLWAPPLLAGATIEEVGDRFDGDLLGTDPKAAWAAAARDAVAAVCWEGVLDRTVHVSFGDIPAADYLSQLVSDHVIHAWDLARAVGGDERLDPELVEFVLGYLGPQVDAWRAGGAFGPAVELPPGADAQSRLLAMSGRRP